MPTETIDARYLHRVDSAADWRTNNPTIGDGEIVVFSDAEIVQAGDGATASQSLGNHQPTLTEAVSSANKTINEGNPSTYLLVTTGASDRTMTFVEASKLKNRRIFIKKVDSGAGKITIDGNGAETIDGQATIDIEVQYAGIWLVCDGTEWHITGTERCEIIDIGGTLEAVYTKVFTGTTDADSETFVAHGVSDVDKIFSLVAMIAQTGTIRYRAYDNLGPNSTSIQYVLYLNATNISLGNVGSDLQSQNYRIELRYWI